MKKLLALLCAAVLGAVGFIAVGCGDNSDSLVLVTSADFPPFEFKEGRKYKGIDIEFAEALAAELGLKLKITNTDFDSVVTSVNTGKADIGMAGLTVSEKRKELVNFSTSYYEASQMIIVKSDNTAFDACTTAAEVEAVINGMGAAAKIGYQTGTTGGLYANGDEDWEFAGFASASKKGYDNGGLAVNDILNGRCNIVVIDALPAKTIVAAKTGVKLINIKLTEEEYAIAVYPKPIPGKEGEVNLKENLLDKINAAIEKLTNDGTLQAIVDKYFPDED